MIEKINKEFHSTKSTIYDTESYTMLESIGKFLEELQNYINYKKYNGEQYINGKCVDCIYYADVLALLDFLYYGEGILEKVNEINEKTKRELKSLLD